jgi:AbiU2
VAIAVRDSTEFQRLVHTLALELVDANIAFKMHTDLIAAYESEGGDAMRQAWRFWSLTIQGHLDSAVLRLCRIYDQDDKNLGLRGFIHTIKSNPHLFSKEQFAARMAGRDHAERLIADFAPLDSQQIEVDMAYVTRATNPAVDRLIAIRHNYYSHRNAKDVVADRAVSERYPHMRDEVGELLKVGLAIVNLYSMLFELNTWSARIIGHDDYHYVLRAAQERLDRHRSACFSLVFTLVASVPLPSEEM